MTKRLAIWKQFFLIIILAGIGFGAWQNRAEIRELTGLSLGASKDENVREGRSRRGGGGGGREQTVPVIVEPVAKAEDIARLTAVGTGQARHSITIYPKLSGQIVALDFEAGDKLSEGQILVRLDERQAKLAVELAQAKQAEAMQTLERYEILLKRNTMAEATVQTARTAAKTAALELEQAQEALLDRTVKAPYAGFVGIPKVEIGDRVSETTAIVTLDDRSSIEVEFSVPEAYLSRLKTGLPIKASNTGFRGRVFEGKIAEIDSRIDPATRTVNLRAVIPNPNDLLRAGMSFDITLTLNGPEYPSIPELALQWEREGGYVWRITDGKAEKIAVSTVKRAEGRILVEGELETGDLVVVEGTQRLRPGRDVNFKNAAPEETQTSDRGSAAL